MPRSRLALEHLEGRWCPALTVALNRATLSISGTADNGSITIVQDSTTPGTITVLDGTTAVTGSPFTGVNNLRLNLTRAADSVTVNLGNKTLVGNVFANLGGGTNSLTVRDGGIGGALVVTSGDGDDTVTLGDGDALTIAAVDLALLGGTDSVTVQRSVAVTRLFATQFANNVTLAAGSTLHNVFLQGGTGGNTVTAAGDVTGDLTINSYFFSRSTTGTIATVTGEVDGNLFFSGSGLADELTLSGNVGKNVFVSTFGGDDKVTISGAISRSLTLDSGEGNDTTTLSNSVGGPALISAGGGNDTLTMTATAKFLARAFISMGAGNDAVTLDAAATIVTMLINGGTGTDTFTGASPRTGLTLVSF